MIQYGARKARRGYQEVQEELTSTFTTFGSGIWAESSPEQERSGGATRESRRGSLAPSPPSEVESGAESSPGRERSGGATRKSRSSPPTPSPPPGVEPGIEPSSLSKRKATNQREPLQDLGEATKEEGEGKRPRRQASKGTPKITPAKRKPVRLRKAKEAGKQAPNTKRNNTSDKDRTQDT